HWSRQHGAVIAHRQRPHRARWRRPARAQTASRPHHASSVAVRMVAMRTANFCIGFAVATLAATAQAEVRIKDLARIDGAHDSSMLGYGLVVGLSGTGDSARN